MIPTRRTLLAGAASLATASVLVPSAFAPAFAQGDPRMAERSLGSADAKVVVQEWFSLTCTHCAAFARETFPRVKTELIDSGRIRYVFKDFPLDQVALAAAQVARSLPPDRYEPFVTALLASQDRWAFARGVNSTEELAKIAALAGMPRAQFDQALKDDALRRAILADQDVADKKLGVNSTPTFIMNGRNTPGAIGFDDFVKAVTAATA